MRATVGCSSCYRCRWRIGYYLVRAVHFSDLLETSRDETRSRHGGLLRGGRCRQERRGGGNDQKLFHSAAVPTSTGTKTFLIFPDLDLRLKPLLLEAAMPSTALSALQRFVDGEFGIQHGVGTCKCRR